MAKNVTDDRSIRIQKSYKGVGRIRVASGTNDARLVQRIMNALDEFHHANNLSILRAVKGGEISPQEALDALTKDGVMARATVGTNNPLLPALESWLATHDVKESTRKSYADHLKQFAKVINKTHTVADLPAVLLKYREKCAKADTRVVFRVVQMLCQAFAVSTNGKGTTFYHEIANIPRFKGKPKKETLAVRVQDIQLLTSLVPKHHAEAIWSLCCTGLRRTEFFEINGASWTLDSEVVKVSGTKTKNSIREVFPTIWTAKPTTGFQALQREISKAHKSDKGKKLPPIGIHTFRKTFRHWCEQAGILRSHIQVYGGWSAQTMLDLYGQHRATENLKEDRRLFEAYVIGILGAKPKPVVRVTFGKKPGALADITV